MIKSNMTKFLMGGAGLIALSGCSLASLPGGYSPIEQQTVQELNTSNYTPRSADERAAILTQDLFAQAAFWSREYDLNPADLEAAINLASTLRRLGNPRKSIEVAQTTRALYPRDVDLMAELAAAHLADNNPKEALPIIDTALAQRPNTARLWSLKGAALDQFEQFAEARQQYSRGLSIAPNDPGIIANVGLSYALEGDPKTAEIWLRRAANMPGASEAVRQNLSLVLGLQNKFGEAEKWANRDMDAQSAANNMSYIRTLRGSTTPVVNVKTPIGSPRSAAPGVASPQNYTPKTYGQMTPPSTRQPARPVTQANYQRPAPTTQRPVAQRPVPRTNVNPYQNQTRISKPATKLINYGQVSPGQAGKPGMTSSRAAALAAAKASSVNSYTARGYEGPQTQQQAPQNPLPQDVLGRISQNNLPKVAIARRQQQELANRAQMQRQAQNQRQIQQRAQFQAQQQMRPQAYTPNGQPMPIYGAVYGQAQAPQPPMAQAQQVRQPARQRR